MMAFFDSKKMLLSHIRHSFVVSDDTGNNAYTLIAVRSISYQYVVFILGMCELIMVKEDVEQEIENDQSFHKKSVRMRQR